MVPSGEEVIINDEIVINNLHHILTWKSQSDKDMVTVIAKLPGGITSNQVQAYIHDNRENKQKDAEFFGGTKCWNEQYRKDLSLPTSLAESTEEWPSAVYYWNKPPTISFVLCNLRPSSLTMMLKRHMTAWYHLNAWSLCMSWSQPKFNPDEAHSTQENEVICQNSIWSFARLLPKHVPLGNLWNAPRQLWSLSNMVPELLGAV